MAKRRYTAGEIVTVQQVEVEIANGKTALRAGMPTRPWASSRSFA